MPEAAVQGVSVPPVVVTRPLQQAQLFAQRLRAAGREAVVFPLLDIHPLDDDAPLKAALADLERYALIAFVSPNAIDAALRVRPHWPRGLTIGVVGEGSRRALAAHGIDQGHATVISPKNPDRTDSETLLEQLDLDALRGRRALIIRGERGRELLADALRHAGAEVEQVAAYRRTAPVLDAARASELSRLIDSDVIWLVTSSEALRNLLAMVGQLPRADGLVRLQQCRLLVPHIRIEEVGRELGFLHIERSGSGDEQMLAKLQLH
jgi:uroporphyrinogen-III synthase